MLKISINKFSWGLEIEAVQLQVKYFHSWELSLWLQGKSGLAATFCQLSGDVGWMILKPSSDQIVTGS